MSRHSDLKRVRAAANAVGLHAKMTDDGEFRIAFPVMRYQTERKIGWVEARKAVEDGAYYTNDPDDAIAAAKDMARRGL